MEMISYVWWRAYLWMENERKERKRSWEQRDREVLTLALPHNYLWQALILGGWSEEKSEAGRVKFWRLKPLTLSDIAQVELPLTRTWCTPFSPQLTFNPKFPSLFQSKPTEAPKTLSSLLRLLLKPSWMVSNMLFTWPADSCYRSRVHEVLDLYAVAFPTDFFFLWKITTIIRKYWSGSCAFYKPGPKCKQISKSLHYLYGVLETK